MLERSDGRRYVLRGDADALEDRPGPVGLDAIGQQIGDLGLRFDLCLDQVAGFGCGGIPVIDDCVENYMLNEPTLAEFVDVQQLSAEDKGSLESAFARVRGALSKLASNTPRYQCQECGFSSQRLLWQCPSCRDWETQRPASRVQFDTVLQHSITN